MEGKQKLFFRRLHADGFVDKPLYTELCTCAIDDTSCALKFLLDFCELSVVSSFGDGTANVNKNRHIVTENAHFGASEIVLKFKRIIYFC